MVTPGELQKSYILKIPKLDMSKPSKTSIFSRSAISVNNFLATSSHGRNKVLTLSGGDLGPCRLQFLHHAGLRCWFDTRCTKFGVQKLPGMCGVEVRALGRPFHQGVGSFIKILLTHLTRLYNSFKQKITQLTPNTHHLCGVCLGSLSC